MRVRATRKAGVGGVWPTAVDLISHVGPSIQFLFRPARSMIPDGDLLEAKCPDPEPQLPEPHPNNLNLPQTPIPPFRLDLHSQIQNSPCIPLQIPHSNPGPLNAGPTSDPGSAPFTLIYFRPIGRKQDLTSDLTSKFRIHPEPIPRIWICPCHADPTNSTFAGSRTHQIQDPPRTSEPSS